MTAKTAIILPSAALVNGQAFDALLQPDDAGCVIVQPLGLTYIQIDIPLSELRKIIETMEAHPKPDPRYLV